jgi:ketosteroid isomerase-like protein
MTTAPQPADVRGSNVALVQRYLDAWTVLDIDAVEAMLHPDVELELGYAPPGVTDLITGKQSVMEFLRAVPSTIAPMNFHAIDISTLEDPAELVAEYRGDSRVLATDKPYRNRYIARARVEDGLIRRFKEYSDPLIFMEAFGMNLPS